MRRSILVLALLSAAFALGSALAFAQADEAEVAAYLDLTIARLELVRDTLKQEKRMLTGDEEQAFFRSRSTTSEAYYAFARESSDQIDEYLAAHPAVTDRINALRIEVKALIEATETAEEAEAAEAP